MDYTFSRRISGVQPSAIREILKSTADPNVISFAAGNPAPEAFPVKEIENIMYIIMADSPISALQYSVSEGYPQLRTAVRQFANSREPGTVREDDEVLIVSGAQQGIELAIKCLVNEGDTVLSESPSFVSALNTIRSYGANLVGVPIDDDGVNIEALENAITTNKNVRLFYTIPNFHNPTGICMSAEKRRQVYELCKRHGVVVLEDNPYGDLRYNGTHIPAIKTLDDCGLVIYIGSFSKIISPGLRVGYMISSGSVMTKLVVAKQCSDVHTNILAQMVCERFLTTSNISGHLSSLQKIYHGKSDLMINALEASVDGKLSWVKPDGGLFLWCTLPEQTDMVTFCREAASAGVAVVPGNAFLTDESAPCRSFRINYSTPSNDQINRGTSILGEVLHRLIR